MNILIIVNTIVLIYILVKMSGYSLQVEFKRTFFGDVPYGIMVWLNRGYVGRGIIEFNFRNPDKIEDYPYIKTKYNKK